MNTCMNAAAARFRTQLSMLSMLQSLWYLTAVALAQGTGMAGKMKQSQ